MLRFWDDESDALSHVLDSERSQLKPSDRFRRELKSTCTSSCTSPHSAHIHKAPPNSHSQLMQDLYPDSEMSLSTEAVPSQSSVLYASLGTKPPRIIGADGNYLKTDGGVNIFDASGGAAVACIGHNNARVKAAIAKQLDTVSYCFSPWFSTEAYESLARFLSKSTNGEMQRVFVAGSGSEVVEAALKMARQYFLELPEPQPQRVHFIARDRSYHGNTLGSLSLSGHKVRRTIYEPILSQKFSHVSPCYPYRGKKQGETDQQYVERLVQELEDEFQRVGPNNVCAFVAETMAGLVSVQSSWINAA